ncbi:hypothetical protein TR2A62_0725 [Thalassobium sp. R2A62]|nr:hypothetical protein TR2A62_0725 [Thalassobium sp. R2A62]
MIVAIFLMFWAVAASRHWHLTPVCLRTMGVSRPEELLGICE